MRDLIFQTICRVGIFMICAQAIVHFRPNDSYEKYLKLLMSIMVLIQLFVPIGSFFLKGGTAKTAKLLEQFERELAEGMQEAEKSAGEADRLLQKMTLEEVRRRAEDTGGENAETGAEKEGGTGKEGRAEGGTGRGSKTGDSGEDAGTDKREGIRIELDGIEPIKIGKEE